ncbi:hypothetical protein K2173_011316 [Erythroxylum novogranatense]|uniref:Uncharacterized protein n=1 Tax=Erythroxylum novogranatense TaxID=1862640 RepID=A0AAV8S996_9ROSI|nr:hypothetical protein K2173_011316 [Erythroxylum novogranatense]
MNPKASGVEVLVPKPIPKIVFKFSDDKLIIKENPSDQNPVFSKALGKNSSTTESEKEIKSLETREKKSKSQVERKRNVSPEAEKSKSKKRRTMVSLELSEEWIIADVLGMTEGKPLKRPKKNKSLVGSIIDQNGLRFDPYNLGPKAAQVEPPA